MSRRVRVAGILAAGALTTAAAGAFSGALALAAPPAHATPAEDCEAVRARDHQIYLNMIAALPPGSPIPPEYINPCLTAPSTTTAPPALPGQAGPSGQAGPGLQVGANAPTLMPRYNGTDIVPVPGAAVPAAPGAPAGAENTPGRDVPGSSAGPDTAAPQPSLPGTSTPTATSDRGPGPVPAANDVPVHPESAPVAVSPTDPGEGRNRLLELALLGAAAFAAAGAGVRGRRTPFGARTPESVLSQTVGTLAAPLMQYAPGGQSQLRVADPFNEGSRFFYLIHDRTSSHEAEIPVHVPPGGHMAVNPDSSVTVFDADGSPVSTVEAPWAYDANGKPIPTHYEVRDGKLVQVVDTTGLNPLYPILADPLTPEERATLEEQAGFIGPMTPAGEQARKNAQATLAANPVQAAADPADSDLAQLMLADPDSQVSEPPITDTGTGNPLGDTILANQTQQPVTSTIGGTDYTTEPADPADSDLAQLMLADPDSQVSEPPITDTGTGNPLGDTILANQTQQPVTSTIGGEDHTTNPGPPRTATIKDADGGTWSGKQSKTPNVWGWNYTDPEGQVHDLQVTYDEQGNPWQVYDNSTSILSTYVSRNGELVLAEPPRHLDPGSVVEHPYTGDILSFVVPPLRGARLIAGAARAEQLIVSNRSAQQAPPTANLPGAIRNGAVPPRPVPNIDGTVPPHEHSQPDVPSIPEPVRPDPSVPEPARPNLSTDPVTEPGVQPTDSDPVNPGEIPVNPEAPGAPVQPGPPDFDPFDPNPSNLPDPSTHPDPTERPSSPPPDTSVPTAPGPGTLAPPFATIEPGPARTPKTPSEISPDVPPTPEDQEVLDFVEEGIQAIASLALWTVLETNRAGLPAWLTGIFAHTQFEGLVNVFSQQVEEFAPNHRLAAERSFKAFAESVTDVRRGYPDSIRPDAVLSKFVEDLDEGTVIEVIVQVWDLKTGNATIDRAWAEKVAETLKVPLNWIKNLYPEILSNE